MAGMDLQVGAFTEGKGLPESDPEYFSYRQLVHGAELFNLEERCATKVFHYRGCGGSDGAYTFRTLPEDVRAAVDELCSGAHPLVDRERLVMIGHSMGGWVAKMEASSDPRIKDGCPGWRPRSPSRNAPSEIPGAVRGAASA